MPLFPPILSPKEIILLISIALSPVLIIDSTLAEGVALLKIIRGEARVVDGDTLIIRGLHIRLAGVDAPETDQICLDQSIRKSRCGIAVRASLAALLDGKEVQCMSDSLDRYGRSIATCEVSGININAWLVSEGLALAFRKYSAEYLSEERSAQSRKVGLWSGAFITPWDWRSRNQKSEIWGAQANSPDAVQELVSPLPSNAAATQNCNIKGNINKSGQRIYHLSYMRDYDKVEMKNHPTKRWFCTEEEAVAAGWRRAKR